MSFIISNNAFFMAALVLMVRLSVFLLLVELSFILPLCAPFFPPPYVVMKAGDVRARATMTHIDTVGF